MNSSHRRLAGIVLAGLTFALPVRAEVAAETNVFGAYVRTVIHTGSSQHPQIWGMTRMRIGLTPLNPRGDVSGDLLPVVIENPAQQRWPWAVWSRFNGHDYDLVWSRWLGKAWSPVAPVEAGPSPFDAVDPAVAFSPSGRAYLVWANQDDTSSGVYLSIFLATCWSEPVRVSDPDQEAINPSILVGDGRIQVVYDTPKGKVTKFVAFAEPATVTDDTIPLGPSGATSNTDVSGSALPPNK
jgi:hypothetical protein